MLFDEANGLLPVPSRCQFIRNTSFIDLYLTHIRSCKISDSFLQIK